MARVKRGTISRRKHKKLLKQTKGYRMSKRKLVKVAHEAVLHAGQYAFMGRKLRKRDMRRLWITRISTAVKEVGWSYNQLIHALKKHNIMLNRKMLSLLATEEPETFKKIVEHVKP